MKTKGTLLANLSELAKAHARGAEVEELMALGGLSEANLRAVMGCDLFRGLAREESGRIARGQE